MKHSLTSEGFAQEWAQAERGKYPLAVCIHCGVIKTADEWKPGHDCPEPHCDGGPMDRVPQPDMAEALEASAYYRGAVSA